MELDWWLDDVVKRFPESDATRWQDAVSGIRHFRDDGRDVDDFGLPVPHGTGPHSFRNFDIWARLIGRTDNVLEIGFNTGNGAAALLSVLPENCCLTSVDIRDSKEVRFASARLNKKFNGRHTLVIGDSGQADVIATNRYGGAFIDGDHSKAGILRDIAACRRLGIRNFLFDDVFPQFGETLPAIRESGLRMLAIVGANMAICEEA